MPISPKADARGARTARIREMVRVVPDFPRAGVAFQDLAPLYTDPAILRSIGEHLTSACSGGIDAVVAIEARGFVAGTAVALCSDRPLVLVRKQGKLPGPVDRVEYALEYGVQILEIQRDAIVPGTRALVVDDVLATGGTLAGAASLVAGLGGEVAGFGVVLELTSLGGRARLAPTPLVAAVSVDYPAPVEA